MEKTFERTWCDYLTECKHFPNKEIGSYDCSQCKHFVRFVEQAYIHPGEYFTIATGIIECNHE